MTKEFKNKATPLMVMLNDRKAWTLDEYEAPVFTAAELAEIAAAVARYASWHASDPFAAARIRHYLLAGLVTARQVKTDLDRLEMDM